MTPQQESTTINRRTLDFEDYVDIIRRHRTAILGPAFGGLVLAVVTAYMWTDTYISRAIIRVVPPQVPERLVPTNVNLQMGERIQAMAQQILSRNSLTNIIQTQNLYPSERKSQPLEDLIERMQTRDIRIGQVQSINAGGGARVPAFSIAYAYSDRIVAQKVCQDLVSRFIDENIRSRSSQSLMTTEFLREQQTAAKARLEELDRKLGAFRTSNFGRLPEEFNTNLSQHYAIENRINALNGSINRVNQEKVILESQYRGLRERLTALMSATSPSSPAAIAAQQRDPKVQRLQADIANLQASLNDLRLRYTDTYPDVQRVEGLLKARRDELDRLTSAQTAPAANVSAQADAIVSTRSLPPEVAREAQSLQAQLGNMQAALDTKDMELADYQKQIKSANDGLIDLERRMRETPGQQSDYAQMMQDRQAASRQYEELTGKMAQSELATDLENRRQGETLEVLDQPSLPQEPSEPNRGFIIVVGAIIGLGGGFALAAMQEFKDSTLKNLKDVRAYTKLTVLGSIPLLENDLVVRRRRQVAWLAWTAACMLGIFIMAGSIFYYYYSTRG